MIKVLILFYCFLLIVNLKCDSRIRATEKSEILLTCVIISGRIYLKYFNPLKNIFPNLIDNISDTIDPRVHRNLRKKLNLRRTKNPRRIPSLVSEILQITLGASKYHAQDFLKSCSVPMKKMLQKKRF